MNILLVGEESAGAQTLKLLAKSDHHLVGVMASPTKEAAGGMTVWQHADKIGCKKWPAQLVKDPNFGEVIRSEKVDLLLNVHSLYLINSAIVEAPRFGSFNLHPGPLPRYAGLNAPSWAIYKGEQTHGVTLHRMLAGIDTGSITYQTMFNIEEQDTGFSVSTKCIKFGLELIKQLLETAAENPSAIPSINQDFTEREYFGKKTPENGWLNWSRPAREVFNFVRAADYSPFSSPWQTPRSKMGELEIEFVKVALTNETCDAPPGMINYSESGKVRVACGDQWIQVNRIKANAQFISVTDVLRSGEILT